MSRSSGQGQGHRNKKVCLCVLFKLLNFEYVDLECSFMVYRYIFRISQLNSYLKVIGSQSTKSQEQNKVSVYRVCAMFITDVE